MKKTATIQMMGGAAMLSSHTFIPILVRDTLGGTELFITLLVGSYAAAMFAASYIFGRAGDIYGRRLVLRGGLLAAMLSFALLLISNTLEVLLVVRILGGFCIGAYPGALTAYAYESDMKMGRFASFGAAGWGAGTLLAGFAAGYNIYYAFLMSTVFLVVAFATTMTLPPVQKSQIDVPLFPVETFKRNASVYLAVLIRHSSASAVWTLWPLFLTDIGGDPFMVALVQATNSVAQVVVMAGVTDRFKTKPLISVGLLTSAVTFFWFSQVTHILEIFPSQILLGISWGCLYVGALKYVTENNEERSTASGLLQSILSISLVIGPIMAAIIYSIWADYVPIMLYAMAMSLLSLIIFRFNSREGKDGGEEDTYKEPVSSDTALTSQ